MKVVVINCGSSSVKYHIYDVKKEEFIAEGLVEKIGEEKSFITHKVKNSEIKKQVKAPDHGAAIKIARDYCLDPKTGVIKDEKEIIAVGHRVVHGGTITQSSKIDKKLIKIIKDLFDIAPLHNPPNLAGIQAMMEILPDVCHVAVFDTSFHQAMPEKAYTYAIPHKLTKKYGIRRYGFHGTSHHYVAREAAKFLGKDLKEFKMITCHLGAGSSLAAIKGGLSIDTSMGFTPLEGVAMATRTGDIDPALPFFLVEKGFKLEQLYKIFNKESGLLGMSAESKDMRNILASSSHLCKLAFDVFCYRIKKYIGAYAAALGGLDVLVFTAGIGENEQAVRSKICEDLEFLGIKLDKQKNDKDEIDISSSDSKVKVLVIPTNEAKMIAQETLRVIGK